MLLELQNIILKTSIQEKPYAPHIVSCFKCILICYITTHLVSTHFGSFLCCCYIDFWTWYHVYKDKIKNYNLKDSFGKTVSVWTRPKSRNTTKH